MSETGSFHGCSKARRDGGVWDNGWSRARTILSEGRGWKLKESGPRPMWEVKAEADVGGHRDGSMLDDMEPRFSGQDEVRGVGIQDRELWSQVHRAGHRELISAPPEGQDDTRVVLGAARWRIESVPLSSEASFDTYAWLVLGMQHRGREKERGREGDGVKVKPT